MNAARKQKSINVVAAALSVFFSLMFSTAFTCNASAAQQRSYGEKKVITTAEEALKTLKKYFEKRDVVIGEIVEKELYFEAEIKDRKDAVIDKVIIDKRTGRIRSIY